MKRIALTGAMMALALPVSAAQAQETTPTPKENAAQACKTERTKLGSEAFKLLYGTNKNRSNAFGKCVSKRTKTAEEAKSNASQDCKAERAAMGAEAFNAKYATNKKKTNGFGKCVSGKSKAEIAAAVKTTVNAAKACKAERKESGAEAFTKKYGGKRNAFGKCVSATAKAQQDDKPAES